MIEDKAIVEIAASTVLIEPGRLPVCIWWCLSGALESRVRVGTAPKIFDKFSYPAAMASSSLARCLRVASARQPSALLRAAPGPAARPFSTTPSVHRRIRIAEDMSRRTRPVVEDDMEELWEHLSESPEVDDAPSSGHLILQQQRLMLEYLRLIEHEMPKLVGASLWV